MSTPGNSYFTKKGFILPIAYTLLLTDIILQFYSEITDANRKSNWDVTEWLVNYQGGFVRRGLPGEILFKLYTHFGLTPYSLIMITCVTAYLAVVAYFIYSFRKKGYTLFLLPFVFFLGNIIINGSLLRKDSLEILFFISIVYFTTKKNDLFMLLANLLLAAAILTHESIGFFCFPIVFLLLLNKSGRSQNAFISILSSILKLSPALITFFFVLLNKGSRDVAAEIWASWQHVPFPFPPENATVVPGTIYSLSLTLHDGLRLLFNTLTDFYDGIYAPAAWLLVIISIYFILTNAHRLNTKEGYRCINRDKISVILIFQFLATLPLFILACDFGRWVFFWVASSFTIYLLVAEDTLSTLFPAFLYKASSKFNSLLDRMLPTSTGFLYLLIFIVGFPAYTGGPTWKIGIDSFYNSSALMIILKLVSIPLKKLFL